MSDQAFEDGWCDPKTERKRQGYNFLKVPARGRVDVICLSSGPLVYRGHWDGRRMVPCGRDKCRFDHSKMGTQKRWVFAVLDVRGRQTSLLDIGAAPAECFLEAEEQFGELRGVAFYLEKESGTLRGRITCRVAARDRFDISDLPPEPDVREILVRVWNGWGES